MVGCAHVGMDVSIIVPKGYEPMESYVNAAKKIAEKTNSKIEILNEPNLEGVDIVYTDVWASMGQEDEAQARKKIFAPYQINSELLSKCNENHIVLHCLPAHRGEEITDEVIEKHADIIFEQAQNRMHAQKAIMAAIIG